MSETVSRAHRIQLAVAAGILAFSIFGGIASAFAQTNGATHGNGGGPSAGHSVDGRNSNSSAVVLFGTPGNCPPTRACATIPQQPRRIVVPRQLDPCGDYWPNTAIYRECRRQML